MVLGNEVVASLDSLTAEMNLLNHPFYQEWTVGKLPLQRLQNYAVQYYHHVAAFPRYLSGIHTGCADLLTRQALLENLIDEERGGENHPQLWLRFAEVLGVARETVSGSEPLPATQALVDTFVDLTKYQPLVAGLAALYVYESQTSAVAAAKIDGLRRFYGITSERGFAVFQRSSGGRPASCKDCRPVNRPPCRPSRRPAIGAWSRPPGTGGRLVNA
jgi:pyrroloquinoline-quinone synthase